MIDKRSERPTKSDDSERLRVDPTLDEETARPLVGAGLTVVGALVLLALVAVLPGADRLFEGEVVSLGAAVLAAATILVVVAVVNVAPVLEEFVEASLRGPAGVVADAAAATRYLVVFVAVVVAYRGLAAAAIPLFESVGAETLYHAGFFLAALVPLGLIAVCLYRSFDPVKDLLTRELVGAVGAKDTPGRAETDRQ